jgi:hypothetical protein
VCFKLGVDTDNVASNFTRETLRLHRLSYKVFMGYSNLFATRLGPACFLLLCLTCSPNGRSTTIRQLDLPDLVQQAEIIADVTVTAVQSYWASPAGGKAIHSRITFSLNSAPLKGQVTSPFTLDFLGGTLGERKVEVSGMPKLQVGDRLILFSYGPDKTFASPVIGFDQGVLRVIRDQVSNVDRVYRWWGQPVNEAQPFVSRVPPTVGTATADQLRSANSVAEFSQRVSRMIHP